MASIITQSVAAAATTARPNTRHQHDDLAIARQPAKGHQDGNQQRHRDGQPKRGRQQRDHQLENGRSRHTLLNQLLGQLDNERDNQDKAQDDQRNREGEEDLPDDVSIENAHS
jgi:hypothetical protein